VKNSYLGPFDKEYRLTGPKYMGFLGSLLTIRALLNVMPEEINSEIAFESLREKLLKYDY